MITDFLVVMMTPKLDKQIDFYHQVLGLEQIFENNDSARTVGFGRDGRIFIVLREDTSADSHHLTEQKGPQIITFKCESDIQTMTDKIKQAGGKVRDTVKLPQYGSTYVFIEDADHNELCLDFPNS